MPRTLRLLLIVFAFAAMGVSAAGAETPRACEPSRATRSPWAITWQARPLPSADVTVPAPLARALSNALSQAPGPPSAAQATQPRPVAFEYSDAYHTRRKIHFYASFATLPLFVSQYLVGQRLYDGTGDDGMRTAHTAIATGTAVLFGVNSVTGVWNLVEARRDPNRRTKRMVHGIMMLAADAGFLATAALAPDHEVGNEHGDRSTHRNVAITSMAVASASYLIMLIGR